MVKLSWEFKEDVPFRGLPIKAEEAEELNDKLHYVSDGRLSFASLSNIFHYSEKTLKDLIELRKSLEFIYNRKIEDIDYLIPKFQDLVKQKQLIEEK